MRETAIVSLLRRLSSIVLSTEAVHSFDFVDFCSTVGDDIVISHHDG